MRCAPEGLEGGAATPLWSHQAGWDDLLVRVPSTDASGLDLGEGWPDRWLIMRRVGGEAVSCPVRELASAPGREGERFSARPALVRRPWEDQLP